jgi:hypothetical protein
MNERRSKVGRRTLYNKHLIHEPVETAKRALFLSPDMSAGQVHAG